MAAPDAFIKALQHEPITCLSSACSRHVSCTEVSHPQDRVKSYRLRCDACGWEDRVSGQEDGTAQWEEAELQAIMDEHLLHLQPVCPYDRAPVVFTSLPNPRRKARYRISCFYCGRRIEMDWPPRL